MVMFQNWLHWISAIFLHFARQWCLQYSVNPLKLVPVHSFWQSQEVSNNNSERRGKRRWKSGGVIWKYSHQDFFVLQSSGQTRLGCNCDQQKTVESRSKRSGTCCRKGPFWTYLHKWRPFVSCLGRNGLICSPDIVLRTAQVPAANTDTTRPRVRGKCTDAFFSASSRNCLVTLNKAVAARKWG